MRYLALLLLVACVHVEPLRLNDQVLNVRFVEPIAPTAPPELYVGVYKTSFFNSPNLPKTVLASNIKRRVAEPVLRASQELLGSGATSGSPVFSGIVRGLAFYKNDATQTGLSFTGSSPEILSNGNTLMHCDSATGKCQFDTYGITAKSVDFGSGADDMISSDGTNLTIGRALGTSANSLIVNEVATATNMGVFLNTAGSHRIYDDGTYVRVNTSFDVDGDIMLLATNALYLNGLTRTVGFSYDNTNVKLVGNAALVPNSNLNNNLGSATIAWSNAYAAEYNKLMGTSSTLATAISLANVNVIPVSSSGNASNLISYTLPANALVAAGRCLEITGWGHVTNNANAKTVSLAVGSQTVVTKSLTPSIAIEIWKVQAIVCRTGTSTQQIFAEAWNEAGTTVSSVDGATTLYQATQTSGTQTETSTIVIKGVATTATTTDITMDGLVVKFL